MRDSENMASLVDTYCSIGKNVQTIWLKPTSDASVSTSPSNAPLVTRPVPSPARKNGPDRSSSECRQPKLTNKSVYLETIIPINLYLTSFLKGNSAHILLDGDETGVSSGRNPNPSDFNAVDLAKFNRIPVENVVFHEKLGSGQFGDVYRGVYKRSV